MAGDKIIFKGGTSLSKGWNLIQRFSEDVDIFLDPEAFDPVLGKNGIDREAKRLRDDVRKWNALRFLPEESRTIGGFGRSDRFGYQPRIEVTGDVAPRVLVEIGAASGRQPTADIHLESYLARFLRETNRSLAVEDEAGFVMRLLHFRRTFVEKLFTIHGKVEKLKEEGRPLGTYARHYYDLYQLAQRPEVIEMLKSPEYGEIKQDYDRVSREYFERDYRFPEDMCFAKSNAIFPPGELAIELGKAYDDQCRLLCYGAAPTWEQVRGQFETLRALL